jgi:hypothetical protein
MCDVQDCTGQCASLVDLVVDPQIGSVGKLSSSRSSSPAASEAGNDSFPFLPSFFSLLDTTFYINATMVIYQPIGAGVIDWTWTSVQDPSFSTGYQALVTSFEQGSYLLSLQEYPAGYGGLQPGNYTVQIGKLHPSHLLCSLVSLFSSLCFRFATPLVHAFPTFRTFRRIFSLTSSFLDVCEGLCGATFPHTALLASANSWMMITEN